MKNSSQLAVLGVACLLTACAQTPAPSVSAAATPPVTQPAQASIPQSAKPSDESLTITFEPARAVLSSVANGQLDGAARLYRDARPEVMIVSGHTDKTGDEFSNLILSARRAEAVKQGLVDRGVPADRLQLVAFGEAEPVPTATANRSAVVTWR